MTKCTCIWGNIRLCKLFTLTWSGFRRRKAAKWRLMGFDLVFWECQIEELLFTSQEVFVVWDGDHQVFLPQQSYDCKLAICHYPIRILSKLVLTPLLTPCALGTITLLLSLVCLAFLMFYTSLYTFSEHFQCVMSSILDYDFVACHQ